MTELLASFFRSVIALLFSSILALASFQASADTALPFKAVNSGETASLQQLMEADKWTVVMIWSTNCHVCNEEASHYSAFHDKHSKATAKVVGISLDGSPEAAQGFVERHQLSFENLVGDVVAVATLYQSQAGEAFRATPTFMVFDGKGQLQAAQAGAVPPEVVEEFIAKSS